MAQTFQINGTSLTYITQAEWGNVELSQALNGVTVIDRWRRHTCMIAKIADFLVDHSFMRARKRRADALANRSPLGILMTRNTSTANGTNSRSAPSEPRRRS